MAESRHRGFVLAMGGGLQRTFVQMLVGAALALALAVVACPACASGGAAGLRAGHARQLAAIDARGLDALPSTVTEGGRLTLIPPNGRMLQTRTRYPGFAGEHGG